MAKHPAQDKEIKKSELREFNKAFAIVAAAVDELRKEPTEVTKLRCEISILDEDGMVVRESRRRRRGSK